MKAIVVIDLHDDFEFPSKADVKIRSNGKTIYRTHMKVRPMPQKMRTDADDIEEDSYCEGWNACLEEISE